MVLVSTLIKDHPGGDIYSIQDGCRFVYRTMDGDFDARVRVTGLTSESHPISKAVLMARETTDAGSVDIMIDVNAPYSQVDTSGNHGRDQYSSDSRSVTGGGTALWGWYCRPASIPDCWIRLLRLGSEFRAYRSLDGGTTWIQTGSNTLSTSSQLLVGLAVGLGVKDGMDVGSMVSVGRGVDVAAVT